MDRKVGYAFLVAFGILATATAVVYYARGYRFDRTTKNLQATGVLRAASTPAGARVFLDGELLTATDDIVNLKPGGYELKIVKEGFFDWVKEIIIEKEVVSSIDAWLLPKAPSLRALTFSGVQNPVLSPDGRKIIYGTGIRNKEKEVKEKPEEGLWIYEMKSGGLSGLGGSNSRQVVKDSDRALFSESALVWGPDSRQILVGLNSSLAEEKDNCLADKLIDCQFVYLLDTDQLNSSPTPLTKIAFDLTSKQWQEKVELERQAQLGRLNDRLLKIVQEAFEIIEFSPDESKILYSAKKNFTLPAVLAQPYVGGNSQPEDRELKAGQVYVYDIEEDKNYPENVGLDKEKLPLQWLPTSRHLLEILEKQIVIKDYDGANRQTIYGGPFENSFVFPWPDAGRLVVLTSFNSAQAETNNLYTIDLK